MLVDQIYLILEATLQTIIMVSLSTFGAILFAFPLGFILFLTQPKQLYENKILYFILGFITNIGRSIPFIILLVLLIPLTRWLVGSSIGTLAASIPLMIAAIPFLARLVENTLNDLPQGLLETGLALGASPLQIVCKILFPEALVSFIQNITNTMITLIGYSAMAGLVGGGGLGDIAIRYGFYRFDMFMMFLTVIILIIMVQSVQFIGNRLSAKGEKKV